jgi:hypothetical protein
VRSATPSEGSISVVTVRCRRTAERTRPSPDYARSPDSRIGLGYGDWCIPISSSWAPAPATGSAATWWTRRASRAAAATASASRRASTASGSPRGDRPPRRAGVRTPTRYARRRIESASARPGSGGRPRIWEMHGGEELPLNGRLTPAPGIRGRQSGRSRLGSRDNPAGGITWGWPRPPGCCWRCCLGWRPSGCRRHPDRRRWSRA